MNEVAKKIVSSRPMKLVASRTSSDEAKAVCASVNASPSKPKRFVRVLRIESRTPSGMKAAMTMTRGKNDTNALPASAMLRSTNSISSMRSHTRQSSRRSNLLDSSVMRSLISTSLPVRFDRRAVGPRGDPLCPITEPRRRQPAITQTA